MKCAACDGRGFLRKPDVPVKTLYDPSDLVACGLCLGSGVQPASRADPEQKQQSKQYSVGK